MEQHCIVKDCKNVSIDMIFYNGICAQCYMYLTQGIGDGQVYRNLVKMLLKRLFNYLKQVDETFDEELPEPTTPEPSVNPAPPVSDQHALAFKEVLPGGRINDINP